MEQTIEEIINSIFEKERLTGKELGQVAIATMIYDIKYHNSPKYEPALTMEEFNALQRKLKTAEDRKDFQQYMDIYSSIANTYNEMNSKYHNMYNHGYWRAMSTLKDCVHAEWANTQDKFTPVIMTCIQYKRLRHEARKKLEAKKETTSSLIIKCLDYFISHEDKAPAEIKEALEECRHTAGANSAYYMRYREFYGGGYYILPNGARSDKMTAEEWEKELKEYRRKSYKMIKKSKLNVDYEKFDNDRMKQVFELIYKGTDYNGRNYIYDYYLEKTGKHISMRDEKELLEALKCMVNDEPAESRALLDILPYVDFLNEGSYREYRKPPIDISMFDMLGIYVNAYEHGEEKEALESLRKDASTLYTAITDYIEQQVAHAKGLLYHGETTWKELAELNFINYRDLLNMEENAVIDLFLKGEEQERARMNGIAILPHAYDYHMDKKGSYTEPAIQHHFGDTLETIYSNQQKKDDLKECIEKLVNDSLKYMYAYNALLEVIAKVYDIPSLAKGARYDIEEYEETAITYNEMLYSLYCTLDVSDKLVKEYKHHIIKQCFKTIDLEDLKPARIDLDGTEIAMKRNNLFEAHTLDPIIKYLMNPKRE